MDGGGGSVEVASENHGEGNNQRRKFAVVAAKFCIENDSVEYELVEFVESCFGMKRVVMDDRRSQHAMWLHMNFLARPKIQSDSSPKLFFAEIRSNHIVTSCSLLDRNASGNSFECAICDPKYHLCHPDHGFRAGCGERYTPPPRMLLDWNFPPECYSNETARKKAIDKS